MSDPGLAENLPLPEFSRGGVAIDPAELTRAPLDYPLVDALFSSVFEAAARFANPLGKYYLYFGPHDPPGGIYLAHADSLTGPWRPYDAGPTTEKLDPVISREWKGAYSVSHVASPDAKWIPEEQKMFLWFHGENDTTRYASSDDGLHFAYEGIAVTAAEFDGISEASYAHISRSAAPERDAQYLLTFMGNHGGVRCIYLAWSRDARHWQKRRTALITPPGPNLENPQVASPNLFEWGGRKYVAYHRDELHGELSTTRSPTGDIWVTPISNNWEVAGDAQKLFVSQKAVDALRVASPFFIRADRNVYMFYDSGPRLGNAIRYATTPDPASARTLHSVANLLILNSSGTQSSDVHNAIDGNEDTYWKLPGETRNRLVLDLQREACVASISLLHKMQNCDDWRVCIARGSSPPDPATELDQWDMVAQIPVRNAGESARSGGLDKNDIQSLKLDFLNGETVPRLPVKMPGSALVTSNCTGLRCRYVLLDFSRESAAEADDCPIHDVNVTVLGD